MEVEFVSSPAEGGFQIHIFILEDIERDFKIVHRFVKEVTAGIHPQPQINRVFSRGEIEQRLGAIKEAKIQARVLIVFDREIIGNTEGLVKDQFDDYITTMWNTDHRTWLGKIRIIVFSKMLTDIAELNQRTHNRYICKLQQGANEPLVELKKAIGDCISSF